MDSTDTPSTITKRVYRKAEVQAATGLSSSALNRAIKRGEVRVVRFGRAVRIAAAELERICNEGIGSREVA